jgi:16S rRNA pseudouridine516 synthase
LILHKPIGYTCSLKDPGAIIYDLLPSRFRLRSPTLSSVGRLDRDTSGLLLMTDDGALLHRIVHPRRKLPKVYEAKLARNLNGNEAEIFACGKLKLESDTTALAPATLEVIEPRYARLTITEGRYHQVRRMFAAVGNHVEELHRVQIGGLKLDDLPSATWRIVEQGDLDALLHTSD